MRAATILLLASALTPAAPVPPARVPPPAVSPGADYRVRWGGYAEYLMVFRAGGEYECYEPGSPWPVYAGTWRLDGRTLRVRERRTTPGPDGADAGAGWWDWEYTPGAPGVIKGIERVGGR